MANSTATAFTQRMIFTSNLNLFAAILLLGWMPIFAPAVDIFVAIIRIGWEYRFFSYRTADVFMPAAPVFSTCCPSVRRRLITTVVEVATNVVLFTAEMPFLQRPRGWCSVAVDGRWAATMLMRAAPFLLFMRPGPLVSLEVHITIELLVGAAPFEVRAAIFTLVFRPCPNRRVAVGWVILINCVWAISG